MKRSCVSVYPDKTFACVSKNHAFLYQKKNLSHLYLASYVYSKRDFDSGVQHIHYNTIMLRYIYTRKGYRQVNHFFKSGRCLQHISYTQGQTLPLRKLGICLAPTAMNFKILSYVTILIHYKFIQHTSKNGLLLLQRHTPYYYIYMLDKCYGIQCRFRFCS